jgi:hypothetical protein
VKDLRFDHVDAIIAKARVKAKDENGRSVGGVEAARKLRKELRRLFALAKKLKSIDHDPVEDSEPIRGIASLCFSRAPQSDPPSHGRA